MLWRQFSLQAQQKRAKRSNAAESSLASQFKYARRAVLSPHSVPTPMSAKGRPSPSFGFPWISQLSWGFARPGDRVDGALGSASVKAGLDATAGSGASVDFPGDCKDDDEHYTREEERDREVVLQLPPVALRRGGPKAPPPMAHSNPKRPHQGSEPHADPSLPAASASTISSATLPPLPSGVV